MTFGWLQKSMQVCLPGAELRRLRRELPNAHRLWVRTDRDIRPESNAEYCARLKQWAKERASGQPPLPPGGGMGS